MANMASVAYAIEGSRESLEAIQAAIISASKDKNNWSEYAACVKLGFPEEELEEKRLGGDADEDAEIDEKGVLHFWAEERWGLQDFAELLEKHFPDIKVYWVVEECGCEVYCTNDKEGKYFPDRFYADTCINGIYQSEYFTTEEEMYKWLSENTNGKIKSLEDAENFNESPDTPKEDFISIHEFKVE